MDEHRKHEDAVLLRKADEAARELGEHVQIIRANCSAGTLTAFRHDAGAPSERVRLEQLAKTSGLDAGARARLAELTEPDREALHLALKARREAGKPVRTLAEWRALRGVQETKGEEFQRLSDLQLRGRLDEEGQDRLRVLLAERKAGREAGRLNLNGKGDAA